MKKAKTVLRLRRTYEVECECDLRARTYDRADAIRTVRKHNRVCDQTTRLYTTRVVRWTLEPAKHGGAK